jgi:PAS domain S-box-containing protein
VDIELVSVLNHEGVALQISQEHSYILGWEPRDLIGRCVFDLVHPEDLEHVVLHYQSLVETKQETSVTFRFQHKDGHWVKFSSRGIPVMEDDVCKGFVVVSNKLHAIDLEHIASMIDFDLLVKEAIKSKEPA